MLLQLTLQFSSTLSSFYLQCYKRLLVGWKTKLSLCHSLMRVTVSKICLNLQYSIVLEPVRWASSWAASRCCLTLLRLHHLRITYVWLRHSRLLRQLLSLVTSEGRLHRFWRQWLHKCVGSIFRQAVWSRILTLAWVVYSFGADGRLR